MSDVINPRSPLAELMPAEGRPSQRSQAGVYLSERRFLGHLNLRGDAKSGGFLEASRKCLAVNLPLEPNTVLENGDLAAFWLGPDEWLLQTPPGREGRIADELRVALHGLFFAVTDLSSGQTVIHISGHHAVGVLRKGCSLDLHPKVFGPGRCAQTLVAKTMVLIRRLEESSSFDLTVRRSFAEYFVLWLRDAAEEYGGAVI